MEILSLWVTNWAQDNQFFDQGDHLKWNFPNVTKIFLKIY